MLENQRCTETSFNLLLFVNGTSFGLWTVSLGMVSWIIASIINFTSPSLGLGGILIFFFLLLSLKGYINGNIDGP